MFRKVIIAVILIIAMLSTYVFVYADNSFRLSKAESSSVVEIINSIDGTKTFDKNYALCVRAKEGTVITFQQYWFKSDDEKSIVSKKKQMELIGEEAGQWMLQETEQWEIGASGIYAKSLVWKIGKNRVKLTAKDKEGKTQEVLMSVELMDKKQLDEFINSYIFKNIDGNKND